jgi:hypothetical protein
VSSAGPLFGEQVCPCYNQRSGAKTIPRWITSEAHCSEMRWRNEDTENDRRQVKATDWILGFASSVAGNHKEMLTLGDELAFEGAPKGCEPGCRCCGSYLEGKDAQLHIKGDPPLC